MQRLRKDGAALITGIKLFKRRLDGYNLCRQLANVGITGWIMSIMK